MLNPTIAHENLSLQLCHLSIGYEKGRQQHAVAQQLSAMFEGSKLTCLLGNNGVGKSTLLRTIAALQSPLDGSIKLVSHDAKIDLASLARHEVAKTIGVVLTDRPYTINMSTRELVAMGRTPHTDRMGRLTDTDKQIVCHAMETTGVDQFADIAVRKLSDGMLQKAMIAKAVAQQTPVILLDEPTAFLDFAAKTSTMRMLLRLAHSENKTIVMSTHDVQLALRLADSIAVMTSSQIEVGSPQQMAAHPMLQDMLGEAGCRLNKETMTIEFMNVEC